MSIYAIGDLHLSFGEDKPMDIFKGWENHTERLEKAWRKFVSDDDTVVVVGDISWALRLHNTYEDFKFLNGLPGKKIILKGNHDYWWTTRKKIDDWTDGNGFNTLNFLFNDSYVVEGVGICGTRGWMCGEDDDLVYERELGRLKRSIESLEGKECEETIVFLHYPPIYRDLEAEGFIKEIKKSGAKNCYYGHVHGASIQYAFNGTRKGIKFKLVSADNLRFVPLKIK